MGVSKCESCQVWLLQNVRVLVCGSWDELGLPCAGVAVGGGYIIWGCRSVGLRSLGIVECRGAGMFGAMVSASCELVESSRFQ